MPPCLKRPFCPAAASKVAAPEALNAFGNSLPTGPRQASLPPLACSQFRFRLAPHRHGTRLGRRCQALRRDRRCWVSELADRLWRPEERRSSWLLTRLLLRLRLHPIRNATHPREARLALGRGLRLHGDWLDHEQAREDAARLDLLDRLLGGGGEGGPPAPR